MHLNIIIPSVCRFASELPFCTLCAHTRKNLRVQIFTFRIKFQNTVCCVVTTREELRNSLLSNTRHHLVDQYGLVSERCLHSEFSCEQHSLQTEKLLPANATRQYSTGLQAGRSVVRLTKTSSPSLGPTGLLFNKYTALLPGGKVAGREFSQCLATSAEDKTEWSHTSTSWRAQRQYMYLALKCVNTAAAQHVSLCVPR
jgi:hypothetical protein